MINEIKVRQGMTKIVTANRLLDGAVVYLGTDGQWLTVPDQAVIATTDEEETALLAQAQVAISACNVVSVYVMPVGLTDTGAFVPLSWRERIRAGGPSVGQVSDSAAPNQSNEA